MKNPFYILILMSLISCSKRTENIIEFIPNSSISIIQNKREELSDSDMNSWIYGDIIKDTIPGISLKKADFYLTKSSPKDTIIVAILDSPIDINHEDLKEQIWINKDEVPNNNIDDDNNGYIDDINGWNFLGNRYGEINRFVHYESTRIIKNYDSLFDGRNIDQLNERDHKIYKLYAKAKEVYKKQEDFAHNDTTYANMLSRVIKEVKHTLSPYFPEYDYTISSLDSLKAVHPKDSVLQFDILRMSNFLKYGYTQEYITDYSFQAHERLEKILNPNYDDRSVVGDKVEDLQDKAYGCGKISLGIDYATHGTIVSGVIGATKNNNLGIDGITNSIKIMPVCISAFGDEHDKDIALGIRYAVDNGAKIINMSFGKKLSLRKDWVDEAIRYAEKHDVLIVSSAGNDHKRIDGTNEYPNDSNVKNDGEVASNFIHVGASSYTVDEELLAYYSNYDSINVDLFAPGTKIKTLLPENQYKIDSGTSLSAAVVSGIAALIWSYYPDLNVNQIKQILMSSGNSFLLKVRIKQEDGTKKMVPFSELSKSGKIVNAYNALLMAEKITNGKK